MRGKDTPESNDTKLPLREPAAMPPTKPSVVQLGLDNIVEGEIVYQVNVSVFWKLPYLRCFSVFPLP